MQRLISILRREREKAHLTQNDLALRMNCSRDTIARIETGRQVINLDQLLGYIRICQINPNVILKAFEPEKPAEFAFMLRMHNVHYITDQTRQQFADWYSACEKSRTNEHIIIRELPDLKYDESQDPRHSGEHHAIVTRANWNLGSVPIQDPVSLISDLGIFIQGADLGNNDLFALTGKRNDSNQYGMIINTNSAITIERQRFSIFHELAHLIAHRDDFSIDYNETGKGRSKDPREIYADAFAGAFLVPQDELERFIQIANARSPLNLGSWILEAKRYFGVSYQTILLRLKSIGYFKNDRQFGIIFGKLRKIYGSNEPNPITTPLSFINTPDWPDTIVFKFSS